MLATLKKTARKLWRHYGSLNNIVLFVAVVIAAAWAWGAVSTIQVNFAAQREVDARKRQMELTQLEVDSLTYQKNYYASDEYKDLAARTTLGLASPGEKVLVLPPNSEAAKQADNTPVRVATPQQTASNIEQWLYFLTGKNAGGLQK